jgi:hypothetical protein
LFDELKDFTNFTDAKSVGGQFTSKNKVGGLKNDFDVKGR